MKAPRLEIVLALTVGASACVPPETGDPHHPGHGDAGSTQPDEDAGSPDEDAGSPDEDAGSAVDLDGGRGDGGPGDNAFAMRVITAGLYAPWEVTWGPDNLLWLTERVGHRISRVDPSTGTLSTLVWISDAYTTSQHEGVLGMALHPELLQGTGNDFVFVVLTYDADPGDALLRRAKIRRYTYDAVSASLTAPLDILSGLPANNDHNGGRLKIGPDGKLYYTLGDQGANQFGNKCHPVLAQVLPTAAQVAAQDWSSYPGKTLRIALDGSIPSDNPVLDGVRSHVYTYGHRNPQGIVFGPDGKLYQSEQGPKTDDEANLLVAGKNYGWPHVAGYQDDEAYEYGNWSAAPDCEQLEFSDYVLPPSVPRAAESAWSHPDFMPPIATFFTVPTGYDFQNTPCAGGGEFICWPTIAPPSIDYYAHDAIPGWQNSLLIPSLKEGDVYVLKLDEACTGAAGEAKPVFDTTNRYRDVAISPDGLTIYVITDNEGLTHSPDGGYTARLDNPGSLLAFTLRP